MLPDLLLVASWRWHDRGTWTHPDSVTRQLQLNRTRTEKKKQVVRPLYELVTLTSRFVTWLVYSKFSIMNWRPLETIAVYSRFSHDFTKIQIKKLSILLSFMRYYSTYKHLYLKEFCSFLVLLSYCNLYVTDVDHKRTENSWLLWGQLFQVHN